MHCCSCAAGSSNACSAQLPALALTSGTPTPAASVVSTAAAAAPTAAASPAPFLLAHVPTSCDLLASPVGKPSLCCTLDQPTIARLTLAGPPLCVCTVYRTSPSTTPTALLRTPKLTPTDPAFDFHALIHTPALLLLPTFRCTPPTHPPSPYFHAAAIWGVPQCGFGGSCSSHCR